MVESFKSHLPANDVGEHCDDTEAKRIWAGTAVLMLCSIISDLGATSGEYAIEDLSLHGEKRGNWKVIVQKEGEE